MYFEGSAVDLDAVVLHAWDLARFARSPVFSDLFENFGSSWSFSSRA